MSIGTKISELRKKNSMTQEALAEKLNVTNQAVSKWESDQCCPDIMLLPALADIFNVTLDELFERSATSAIHNPELPWDNDSSLHAVLFVGHKLQTHRQLHHHDKNIAKLEFHGSVNHIFSDFSVECRDCNIQGNVQAGDGVNCGDVHGDVTAGDGVNCGNVEGSVRAGDGVCCGNIGGNASAGDSISCGNIDGDVTAGDRVNCGYIGGSVTADSVRMR